MMSDLAGIEARGQKLRISVRTPAPDFITRIAFPYFCAVPTDTPLRQQRVQPIPTAGPYFIASYVPKERLVLRKNPSYTGARPRRFAEIDYTFGVDPRRTVAAIQASSVDYAATSSFTSAIPAATVPSLIARYGRHSPAAKAGHEQYFENPSLGEVWLALNTNRPPFSDERIRRAVAFAIDRPALAIDAGYAFRPDDHLVPPVLPGYEPVHYYPLRKPDLKTARRLMHGRHVMAVDYTCTGCSQQVLQAELAKIGIDLVVREFPAAEMLRRVKTAGEPVDIYTGGVAGVYPDPVQFLNSVLVGRYIAALAPHDQATLARLAAAARLTGSAREQAYGRVDVELAKRAFLVPLGHMTEQDFFSRRIGCQLYQPIYGMDLGALCLRPR